MSILTMSPLAALLIQPHHSFLRPSINIRSNLVRSKPWWGTKQWRSLNLSKPSRRDSNIPCLKWSNSSINLAVLVGEKNSSMNSWLSCAHDVKWLGGWLMSQLVALSFNVKGKSINLTLSGSTLVTEEHKVLNLYKCSFGSSFILPPNCSFIANPSLLPLCMSKMGMSS